MQEKEEYFSDTLAKAREEFEELREEAVSKKNQTPPKVTDYVHSSFLPEEELFRLGLLEKSKEMGGITISGSMISPEGAAHLLREHNMVIRVGTITEPLPEGSPVEEKVEAFPLKGYRSFFAEKSDGPTKELTLADAVRIAATPRIFFSKRMVPAFTVCNARVFCGGEYLLKSDLTIPECAERLFHVAKLFGVTLEITYESGSTALWSSDTPTMWLGFHPYGSGPIELGAVEGWMREIADRQQEKWMSDHGLAEKIKDKVAEDQVTYEIKLKVPKKKKKNAVKKKVAKKKVAAKVVKKKAVKKKKGRSK